MELPKQGTKEYSQLVDALMQLEKKDANENYLRYVEIVNTSVNEEADWKRGKHLVFLCEKLQKFIEEDSGNAYDIMIISVPPQMGKSTAVTEALPSWFLGKHPDKNVIALAYGDDLAQRFGRRNKDKVERFGKRLFGIEVSTKKSANDDFEIKDHRGRMITRGIMAGITGNPADLLLIDDPIKTKEEAYSEVYRDKLWGEWQNSIKSRLASGAKVVLIMTRWHEDDMAGRIIATEKNVLHINIPCEAEEDDVLGRSVGEGLFPEIGKGTAWKDQMKESYVASEGMEAWNALYQGRPSAQKGNIFNRGWWKRYDILPEIHYMILSVDASFKDKDSSDPVSMGVWGKNGVNLYLIEELTARMDFIRTLNEIKNFKSRYPLIRMILIEDKANGSAIISVLRREINGIIPVEPLGSKEARARAISPLVEAGNVWLPSNSAWVEDYIDELAKFPKGKHDDRVDMTSQALIRFKDFVTHGVQIKEREPDFKELKKKTNPFFGGKPTKSFIKY